MKIGILITVVCMLFVFTTFAQSMNKMINDTTIDQEVLIDYCDRSGLESGEFGIFYKQEYEDYAVNDSLVKLISKKIRKCDIIIVFGSWCSDSEQQLPRFYKILDHAKFKDAHLKIVAINRSKSTIDTEIDDLNIERVPTFIVYRKGKEIGRIVETPFDTLEEDLWKIIQ